MLTAEACKIKTTFSLQRVVCFSGINMRSQPLAWGSQPITSCSRRQNVYPWANESTMMEFLLDVTKWQGIPVPCFSWCTLELQPFTLMECRYLSRNTFWESAAWWIPKPNVVYEKHKSPLTETFVCPPLAGKTTTIIVVADKAST